MGRFFQIFFTLPGALCLSLIFRNTLTVNPPLLHAHYSGTWQSHYDSTAVSIRTEVGYLTRNIIIQGDINDGTSGSQRWSGFVFLMLALSNICVFRGGHILATSNSAIRMSNVELTN